MAAQRGWSIEEIAQELLEVSEKAQERARCRDEGVCACRCAERGRSCRERPAAGQGMNALFGEQYGEQYIDAFSAGRALLLGLYAQSIP